MLNILSLNRLADWIGYPRDRLVDIADRADEFCEELILLDPAKPNKPRPVLSVRGDLRKIQERLLRKVFISRLSPSPHAHGGIAGRHIKTNAELHARSVFLATSDISNFYPSVSHDRVYHLFVRLGCSPDVARILTMFCTHDHHLALGLATSPFLAEQFLIPVDRRINAACRKANLIFTRFVDDISISGMFDLSRSGFTASVERILLEHGFKMHPDKTVFGRLSDGAAITKITIRNGHPDVRREYLEELIRQLDDVHSLANCGAFAGPYFTRDQLAGRVQFICWINPGRRRHLVPKLNSVRWKNAAEEASRRGLFAATKRLVRKDGDYAQSLA